jgi:hypothetical protein
MWAILTADSTGSATGDLRTMSYGNVPGQPAGHGGPGGYGGLGGYGGPGYGGPGYAGPPPNSYLVWAILATLFCCVPFGIVSIVFAAQVDSKWTAGDYYGAMDSSRKAKNWLIASASVGGAVAVIYLIILATVVSHQST